MEILQKLKLPRPINDYSLNNEEVLDLKHVISAQKNKYSNSINNRLNNHESAISNISIFKLFAMFVPPLFIIIVIIIICFIFKTKKIGQLVALSSLAKGVNTLPLSGNSQTCYYIDTVADYIILAIIIMIAVYWIMKNYGFLITIINTISLPFNECMLTRKNSNLKLILYLSNLKDYCYIYIDTLPFCTPENIMIIGTLYYWTWKS